MAAFKVTLEVEADSLTGAWRRVATGFPTDLIPSDDWNGIRKFTIDEVTRTIEMTTLEKENN